jgi:hypothetical protein
VDAFGVYEKAVKSYLCRGVCRFQVDSLAPLPLNFYNGLRFTPNTNVQSYPRVPRLVHLPWKFSLSTRELSAIIIFQGLLSTTVSNSAWLISCRMACICRPGVQLELALSIPRSTKLCFIREKHADLEQRKRRSRQAAKDLTEAALRRNKRKKLHVSETRSHSRFVVLLEVLLHQKRAFPITTPRHDITDACSVLLC